MTSASGHPPTSHHPSGSANTYPNYMENGREYHGYHKGQYLYPCDDSEQNRMDMFHQLFLTARHNELHSANIRSTDNPDVRILDLGCGTGIWAIDVADQNPKAEVIGIDLANIQPARIPPNLTFQVNTDYTSVWTLGEESFDLIHLQQAAGSVQSWASLYQKIFNHLKPGIGAFEQVEIDLKPRCDDGSMPHAPMVQWYEYLADATSRANRPIAYQENTREMLEAAGFVHIQHQKIQLPFNTWHPDPHKKAVGRWYCAGFIEWVEGLSMQPFTKVFGWKKADVQPLVEHVKQSVMKKRYHGYNEMHIWTAKRPAS